jgi:hypothetical protein
MTVKARRRGRYIHNPQQTQETIIHDLSRIRTSDRSNQAALNRTATGIGAQQFLSCNCPITQIPSLFLDHLPTNLGFPWFWTTSIVLCTI